MESVHAYMAEEMFVLLTEDLFFFSDRKFSKHAELAYVYTSEGFLRFLFPVTFVPSFLFLHCLYGVR